MQDKRERWEKLRAQAAVEQDSAKLLALVQEINLLLEEKQRRLEKLRNNTNHPPR